MPGAKPHVEKRKMVKGRWDGRVKLVALAIGWLSLACSSKSNFGKGDSVTTSAGGTVTTGGEGGDGNTQGMPSGGTGASSRGGVGGGGAGGTLVAGGAGGVSGSGGSSGASGTGGTESAPCGDDERDCLGTCIPMGACCGNEECPAGATCNDGQCSCEAGTHQCGDTCESDTAIETCGVACDEPCVAPTGGDVTCDGTQCVPTCPSGEVACFGECIDEDAACEGECPSGTHECSGVCLSDSSVIACGSACTPCPVPANASATCDGVSCDFVCNADQERCQDRCIPQDACCDSSECQQNAVCNSSNACQCASGFKNCAGQCIPNSQCCVNGDCGQNETCSSGSCGCSSGFKRCTTNGPCISNSSCCTNSDCPAGASCQNNSCVCSAGYYGTACNYYFVGIGFLSGHNNSEARGVSADGSSVVGASRSGTSATGNRAIRWRSGTLTNLGLPASATASTAFAASSNGNVVIGDAVTSSGDTQGFHWSGGTITLLPLASYGTYSTARDISDDGSVIVGWGDRDSEHRALVWTNQVVATYGPIDPLYFNAVTPSGTLFGGRMVNAPAIYDTSVTQFGLLNGYSGGEIMSLTATGTTRGAGFLTSSTNDRAVRWTAGGTAQDMGTLSGSSRALAISSDGSIIVGTSGNQAFVWDSDNGMRSLATVLTDAGVTLTGWSLQSATGVSANGKTIVGYGTHDGATEGFVAALP